MEVPEPTGVLTAVLFLAVGLVILFAGYALATSLAALFGFIAGFAIGLLAGALFLGPFAILLGIGLGIVFALLARFAFRVLAAFLLGSLSATAAVAFGLPTWGVVLLAIAGGLVGLIAHRIVLVVAASLLGAALTAAGGLFLARSMGMDASDPVVFSAVVLVLALLGIVVQSKKLREEH